MIVARWLEQRSGAAATLEGKPAGPREFTWYSTRLVVAAAVVWVVANVLGNHVLK